MEPYSKNRDETIKAMAKEANIQVVEKVSHTLYNSEALYGANGGKLPMSYMEMLDLVEIVGSPMLPCATPIKIPTGCEPFSSGLVLLSELLDVPTLKDLGVDESKLGPCLFPGGESEGMTRLNNVLSNKKFICCYEKPFTNPTSIVPSTTALSPYLAMGCISPRTFYMKLTEAIEGSVHTKPPVSLLGQLIWREFYYLLGDYTNNFNQMSGNNLCIQIPWKSNHEWLNAWANGRTGFPFIDAVMIQLRQEGWIHHTARQVVAYFLTLGDLWVSWEEGQAFFQEMLIDYDWPVNSANWILQSGSALFHILSFHRVFCPVQFPKATDPDGIYVRKYIPVLRKVPSKFVYEPWRAPDDVLRNAGCILGEDYPHRIVNHYDAEKRNFARIQKAFKRNTHRQKTLQKLTGKLMADIIP